MPVDLGAAAATAGTLDAAPPAGESVVGEMVLNLTGSELNAAGGTMLGTGGANAADEMRLDPGGENAVGETKVGAMVEPPMVVGKVGAPTATPGASVANKVVDRDGAE